MMSKKQCCALVSNGPRTVGFHRCYNAVKFELNGKGYCTIHYPPNVESRSKESTRRWQERNDRELNRSAMFKDLVSALRDMTPPMPPADAPCHLGSCEQSACAHCQRVARAQDLLKKAEKYE